MTQRQHLLNIRYEFDELVHAVQQQPSGAEHELILARIERARTAINNAILELDQRELEGYDC